MTFSLGMPTVARPYRRQTFQRLVETGTLEHPSVRGFHLVHNRTPNSHVFQLLRACLSDDTEWVIYLEDDIDIIDDFLGSTERWLADVATPDVLFYPLGCGVRGKVKQALAAQARRWNWPLNTFFGATGFAMRSIDAFRFLEDCCFYPDAPPSYIDASLDHMMRRWHLHLSPARMVPTPVPCFVDHLGEVSSQQVEAHWTGSYVGWQGRGTTYP
jgi:hypothetical protein